MNKITPRIGVGEVNFSGGIEPIVAAGYLEDVAGFDEIMGWRTFRKDNQLECYVKDDAVVCIACFENCVIGDFSLIGKKLPELLRVLGQPDEVGEIVWVRKKPNKFRMNISRQVCRFGWSLAVFARFFAIQFIRDESTMPGKNPVN